MQKKGSKERGKGHFIEIYKLMVVPTLLYGSQVWTITKNNHKRIQAVETKFLRPVAVLSLIHI